MIYGEKLRNIREEKGIRQYMVANLLNVSRSLYGRYETEHETMPTKHLNTVCNYFKISFDYVFNFKDKKCYNNYRLDIDKKLSGLRLKEFRKKFNLNQIDLANILNTSQSTIAEYERGTNIIATPFLYTICKNYKISADYLLGKVD